MRNDYSIRITMSFIAHFSSQWDRKVSSMRVAPGYKCWVYE